jgi:small subunit ribosomal protein S1
MTMTNMIADNQPTMATLLNAVADRVVLSVGDTIKGKIQYVVKNQVIIDIENIGVGVIRGKELYNDAYVEKLKIGEEVEAIVTALDSNLGAVECSFRAIGHDKVLTEIKEAIENKTTVEAKVRDVNRGGFMIKVQGIDGFLPASLLAPIHAVKQSGEDKSLLNQMRKFVGQNFNVKIINFNPESESIIVSEKAVSDEYVTAKLAKHKIGDVVEGVIAGAVDFGLFVRFDDDLDGLVHISEIAWKKIDDPRTEFKNGDKITVKIIDIDGDNRINLSIKQTIPNPWVAFMKKAKIGADFKGKVVKVVSYGLIVIDEETDIQGLCHISQITDPILDNPAKIHDIVKLGDIVDFKILSIGDSEKLYLTLLPIEQALKIHEELVAKQEADREERTANYVAQQAAQQQEVQETAVETPAETV